MLLISLNEAVNRQSIDLLLALSKVDYIMVSGEGVLSCAALIASDLVEVDRRASGGFLGGQPHIPSGEKYYIELTNKGRMLVDAWKRGDQEAAINSSGNSNSNKLSEEG